MGKHSINSIIKTQLRKALNEAADERDSYVKRDGNDTYSIDNSRDLSVFLHDPKSNIEKGQFVNITYMYESAINKTFKNDGYIDDNGNVTSADELEAQGRAFNKSYLNDFYNSDEYKAKRTKKRGASRPFSIFTLVSQQLNWAAMNYGKSKDEIDKLFKDASDVDLNDFTANDADFAKRIAKYKETNPDMADEIDAYASTNSFPRDMINKIRNVKLKDTGKGWDKEEHSEYISRHAGTDNEALRLTKSSQLLSEPKYFVVLSDGDIKQISKDEYYHLKRAFGGGAKKTSPSAVVTSIRKAMQAINARYEFRDYLIPQIATMSFKANGKQVRYVNHELNVGGITIDANDIPKIPMSENKLNNIYNMKKNRIRLSESQLNQIIRESVQQALAASDQEQIEEGWLGDKWNQAKLAYGTATQSNDRMGLKDRFQAAKKNWQSQGQLNNINALIQQISQFVDSGEINPQMTIGQLIGGKYNKGRFGKMTSIANNQRNQIKRRGGEAY